MDNIWPAMCNLHFWELARRDCLGGSSEHLFAWGVPATLKVVSTRSPHQTWFVLKVVVAIQLQTPLRWYYCQMQKLPQVHLPRLLETSCQAANNRTAQRVTCSNQVIWKSMRFRYDGLITWTTKYLNSADSFNCLTKGKIWVDSVVIEFSH